MVRRNDISVGVDIPGRTPDGEFLSELGELSQEFQFA